ncbi:MAG: ATP12 family protein [Alphaproteobacteria bacterium]
MANNENTVYKEFNDKLQNDAFKPDAPKKFWSHVEVKQNEYGYSIFLDGRVLKTPLKKSVSLPNLALAEAVAAEWQAQQGHIKPRTMPLSRLAMTVIDQLQDDPKMQSQWITEASQYLETDLLLFPSPSPQELYMKEQQQWLPLIEWSGAILHHQFHVHEGLSVSTYNQKAVERLKQHIQNYNLWKQAAYVTFVQICGSAIVALAVAEGKIDGDNAQKAVLVQEYYQRDQWGSDAELDAQIANKKFEISAFSYFLQHI